MSFVVSAFGLTGMAATLAAGAAYGGMTTVGMNLIQGKDAFANIGQGILLGGAGAGIASGLGSALGGQTVAELSGPAAQAELAAAGQTAGNAGLKASEAAMTAANTNTLATNSLVDQATLNPDALMSGDQYRDFLNQTTYRPPDFAANSYSPQGIAYQQSQGALPADIAQQAGEAAANSSKFPGYSQATKDLMKPASFMKNPADYMVQNPSTVAGAVTGIARLLRKPDPLAEKAGPGGNTYKYDYSPAQYGPDGRPVRQASYGTPTVTHYAAAGGPIRFAKGGDIYSDDPGVGPYSDSAGRGPYSDAAGKGPYSSQESGLSQQMRKIADPAVLKRYAEKAYGADVQAAALKELRSRSAAVRDYGDETNYAAGGIASLPNEYAAGGKLLQGPGDGMSDSIPAVIKGPRPQRAALAQGEFVIPADVVSHLGNGSTDAGSKRLYAMMDKIRHARTGTKKQGKQINPNQFLLA